MENLRLTSELKKETVLGLYRSMLRIRMVETAIADNYYNEVREMHTPIHLYDGQEAVAVGICAQMELNDVVFSNHRCHGHYLAKGGNLCAMIAELFSKEDGCCHGMGGSMHLTDRSAGVAVSSAIVAGNVSIATGYALAMKQKNANFLTVVFLGDGASEEGSVYESICFAQIHKLPILYVCENNLYAISTKFSIREPLSSVSDKFRTILPTKIIDGNNIFEVFSEAEIILNKIRNGCGPFFLECQTYRLRDHHNVGTGIQSGYRTQDEWLEWSERSPLEFAKNFLLKKKWITDDEDQQIIADIQKEIDDAFAFARKSAFAHTDNMTRYLWG